jgi:ankyrin repeat protein
MGFLDKLVIAAIEQGETGELEKLLKDGGASPKAVAEDGASAMHVAARKNNVAALKLLHFYGGGVHACDRNGNTPLLAAAEEGHVEAAQFLAGKGAAPNARNKATETSLHLAAKNGRRKMVEYLAREAKYMLDYRMSDGRTALMMAAANDNAQSVKALIEAGADPRLTDEQGRNAMAWAFNTKSRGAESILSATGTGHPMRYGLGYSVAAPSPATFDKKNLKKLSP